jgi:hypothetical protein
MRKLTTILLFVSIAMTVFAWPTSEQVRKGTGAISGYDNASGTWRPVAINQDTGALITDAEVNIGSVTVDAFPVYADEAGNVATAVVDVDSRAIVNIGSDTSGITGLLTNIYAETQSAGAIATETLTLVANVSQNAGGNLASGVPRKFIAFSPTTDEEYWVDFSEVAASGTVSTGFRCVGNTSFAIRGFATASIIASSAMSVYVIEGGAE